MSKNHSTMIGCPSCAGCLRLDEEAHGHRRFVCSVGHVFSLWDLYESKENELERAQWSTIALLAHLQMILDMLLEFSEMPDAPNQPSIRRRIGQVQKHITAVHHVVEGTTIVARQGTSSTKSRRGGKVRR